MLQWQYGNVWKRTTKDYHIVEPVLDSGGSISRFDQMLCRKVRAHVELCPLPHPGLSPSRCQRRHAQVT